MFKREADMLEHFGRDDKHNVRLLARIVERPGYGGEKYSLLFPWADCDLKEHMETRTIGGPKEVLWMAEQCYGLADALSFIHDPGPEFLSVDQKRIYGRHGDIKPHNILWFKNDKGQRLTFSDMGLTEVHRDASRSNIPGKSIPHTPTYRPPECDMTGREGHISRSFDIWTLGCVFLEIVVWMLMGPEGIASFKKARNTQYLDLPRYQTPLFFSLHRIEGESKEYAFDVQKGVTAVRYTVPTRAGLYLPTCLGMLILTMDNVCSGSRSYTTTHNAPRTSMTFWI
jgi:serine/threonine protein kinase